MPASSRAIAWERSGWFGGGVMRIRRVLVLVPVVTVLLLAAGTAGALARAVPSHGGGGGGGGGGGSSLTLNALSPDTTTPYSNTQDFIYVYLTGNAPSGGIVVNLSSSNQAVMPIPASVTVAAGSDAGQVEFTAGNVTTATPATFTATLGSASLSVTITVEPVPVPTLFDVNLLPGEAASDSSVTVEPDLNNPAPSGGVTVSLSSSNPSVSTVPATVDIPAGQYRSTFSITTGTVTAVTDGSFTASMHTG
jgi:hypothetical protein